MNAGKVTVVINIATGGKDANTVTVNSPKTTQQKVINNKVDVVALVIEKPDISMNLAAITEINKQANVDVQLSAARMDNSKLSGEAKVAIGNRPVFDLKPAVGWKQSDGKWNYLYTDGSMAANTKIDGYEIGLDGAGK